MEHNNLFLLFVLLGIFLLLFFTVFSVVNCFDCSNSLCCVGVVSRIRVAIVT